MATKPDKFPEWANDNPTDPTSGQSARVAPPQSKKDSGWSREEVPPRQWFNWLFWKINQWVVWFEDRVEYLLTKVAELLTRTTEVEARTETLVVDAAGDGDIDLTGATARFIRLTGERTGSGTITFDDDARSYWILNETTGGFDLDAVTETGSTPITIQFKNTLLRSDGSEMIEPRANLAGAITQLFSSDFQSVLFDSDAAFSVQSNGGSGAVVVNNGTGLAIERDKIYRSTSPETTGSWSEIPLGHSPVGSEFRHLAIFYDAENTTHMLVTIDDGSLGSGGGGRAFTSTDNGSNWTDLNLGETEREDILLLTDARGYHSDNGVFVIFGGGGNIMRSGNTGSSWVFESAPATVGPGWGMANIGSNWVVAAGRECITSNDAMATDRTVVSVYDQAGVGLTDGLRLRSAHADNGYFYLSGNHNTDNSHAVVRSDDNGATWELVFQGRAGEFFNSFITGSGSTVILLGSSGSVWISEDNGDNWTEHTASIGSTRFDPYSARLDVDGNTVFVAGGTSVRSRDIKQIKSGVSVSLQSVIEALEW